MGRLFVLAALIAVLLGAFAPRYGSAQEALTVQVNSTDTAGFPRLSATVTVLGNGQRPVLGLGKDAFQATAGGPPLPISDVVSANDSGLGIGVLLAFDTSGSMQGAPIDGAKEAGKALLAQLAPVDQAAVLTFSNSVDLVQPFTADRGALTAAIDRLSASGNTQLYSAVAQSAQIAEAAALPRHAVVLLSDGFDFGGLGTIDAAGSLGAAAASNVPFFVVGLGNQIDQPYLEQLAATSKGQLLLAPGPDALGALYQNIGSILRHQYVLTIDGSTIDSATGAPLRITVTAGGVTASAETPLNLPANAVTSPAASVTAVAVTPAATPASQTGGGGSSTAIIIALVAGGLGIAGVAGVFFWRRRKPRAEEIDLGRRVQDQPTPPLYPHVGAVIAPTEAKAYLQMNTEDGVSTYPLGDLPVTVGFASDCQLRLPNGGGGGWERARIWRREGRYMLHNLSRMGGVSVGGRPASWAILEDGDEVQIGGHRLIFREPAESSS